MNGDHTFDDADIIREKLKDLRGNLKKDLLDTFPLIKEWTKSTPSTKKVEWLNGAKLVSELTEAGIDENTSVLLIRMFFSNYYGNTYDDLNYLEELDAVMEDIACEWSDLLHDDDYPKISKALKEIGR